MYTVLLPTQAHTALRAEGPESRLSGSELLLPSHHSAWEHGAHHATSIQLTICVQRILHGCHRGFSSTLECFWSHDMQPVLPSPRWRLFEMFRFCFLSAVFILKCQSFTTMVACDSPESFLLKVETLSVPDELPRHHLQGRCGVNGRIHTFVANSAADPSLLCRFSSLFLLLVQTAFTTRFARYWTLTSLDSRLSTMLLTFKVWPTMSSTPWERCVLLWEMKISESWRRLPTSWRCWG